ncbi:helix-turn-helix domain-containing protein [Brucella pituitosa]|uniref:helix-turn-helix domain-containing protein n=1 Tax=Brucella pituitosa TaxID=571256 RepID=UPI000C27B8EC|nr:helix-turn-helix domain-containing protein [Brucella pituitosa]PJO48245.1 AraC family transcriptional regulator [Brucella pituitosa]
MTGDDNHSKAAMNEEILVSTNMVEESLRSDFWREASRPFYETTPIIGSNGGPLEGTIKSREVAGLTFATVSFNDQRYRRDRRIIAWSGLDQFLVAVVTGGMIAGDFANTHLTAQTGDICILDLTQILQCEVSAGGTLSALIPRGMLAKATGYSNLHGLVLKSHLPMVTLLTAYLEGLSSLKEHLSNDESGAIQESLVTILAEALRGQRPDNDDRLPPLSMALRQRVLDFVDQHINDPELSLGLILQRFNVSRTHLYRAFAEDGGIATQILGRRLDAAFLELTRTDSHPLSVANIAFAYGFSSSSHFSRCFRMRFGLMPKEARHERLSGSLAQELRTHLLRFGKNAF